MHLAKVANGDKYAGGAEIVAVVVNVISFDAGEIADRQTDVERAGIDHAFGQQPVLVQPFKKAYAKAQQPGNAEQGMDQLFGAVVAVHLAVFLYVGVDLVVD